jgi:hypothetical protein
MPFNYKKSDERGIKVNPSDKNPKIDSLKKVIERGARLQSVRSLSDGTSKLFVEDGELRYDAAKKENSVRITKEGNFELFGDLKIHGDVQRLGKRIEVWQNVITTGDNLIELNDNLEDTKVPYSGIEVKRGKDSPAFLVFTEDDRRWAASLGDIRRKVALHGDKLSKFEQDLTTDDIEEGEKNKYARPTTSTHNFWVSDEVQKTVGTDKKILPTFVSIGKYEKKLVTKIRSSLSAGSAEIVLLVNEKQNGSPMAVARGIETEKMSLP